MRRKAQQAGTVAGTLEGIAVLLGHRLQGWLLERSSQGRAGENRAEEKQARGVGYWWWVGGWGWGLGGGTGGSSGAGRHGQGKAAVHQRALRFITVRQQQRARPCRPQLACRAIYGGALLPALAPLHPPRVRATQRGTMFWGGEPAQGMAGAS